MQSMSSHALVDSVFLGFEKPSFLSCLLDFSAELLICILINTVCRFK